MKKLLLCGKTLLFLLFMITISSRTGALKVYAQQPFQMESLSRGTVAVQTEEGVFVSWRLLGTEPADLKFDLYKNGALEAQAINATNYQDPLGFVFDQYEVVPAGEKQEHIPVRVWNGNHMDIPVQRPEAEGYAYTASDVSAADLDGDGELELILKWLPTNHKEAAEPGRTGNMYLDAYKMNGSRLWRVDLGQNIRAGTYDAPFLCYDFDGDGKAELVMRTAPGSKDSAGEYVSRVGENITWGEDTKDYAATGEKEGYIVSGPDWITVFDGFTGCALQTVDYPPQRGTVEDWGDDYGANASYYLAGVAYLNGTSPAIVFCRGAHGRIAVSALQWDGIKLSRLWLLDSSQIGDIAGCGSGNLSIADIDQDGKDEIILGALTVDDNGTVLQKPGDGYSNSVRAGDFNGDGETEVFRIQSQNSQEAGVQLYRGNGELLAWAGKDGAGRGQAANLDDSYAAANPSAASMFWSDAEPALYSLQGNPLMHPQVDTAVVPPQQINSLVYWDGDFGRELLNDGYISKYTVQEGEKELQQLEGIHSNSRSQPAPSLVADLFGDWREEVVYPTAGDKALRIFTTMQPTSYKLTALLHDRQYRCAVAGQNAGLHQPPEASYYIGQSALMPGENHLKWTRPQIDCPRPVQQRQPEQERRLFFDSKNFEGSESSLGFSNSKVVRTSTGKGQILQTDGDASEKMFSLPQVTKDIEIYRLEWEADELLLEMKNRGNEKRELMLVTAFYESGGTLAGVRQQAVFLEPGEYRKQRYPARREGETKIMIWEKESMQPISPALTEQQPFYSNSAPMEFVGCTWKPGAGNGALKIVSDTGAELLQIQKEEAKALMYSTALEQGIVIDEEMKTQDTWYSIQCVLDRENGRMQLSVMDQKMNCTAVDVLVPEGEHIGGLGVSNGGALDACRMGQVINYQQSIPTLFQITANGSPVLQSEITVDGKTMRTDPNGQAMLHLKPGSYDYVVSKNAYQNQYGKVEAGKKAIAELSHGRVRRVYLQRKDEQGVSLGTEVLTGQAIENTWYTFSEEEKADVQVTDQEGNTAVFELDPDASEPRQYIGQGGDAYLTLSYSLKKVPRNEGERELLKLHFSPYGAGRELWEGQGAQYKDAGTKYALFSSAEKDTLSVPLPNTSQPLAIEFDIRYEQLDLSGFGIGLHTAAGEQLRLGMWESAQDQPQWTLGYTTGADHQMLPYVSSDPRYTYAENWKNQWAHFILLLDQKQMHVTVTNRTTGVCYVQDAVVPFALEGAADKITFGRLGGSGTGVFGLSKLKAYTVTAPETDAAQINKEVAIPSVTDCSFAALHVSELDHIQYNCSPVLEQTYHLEDEAGNPIQLDGVQLNEEGILTVGTQADKNESYYAVTKINGVTVQKLRICYKPETVLYESKFLEDTEGFQFKGGSNTTFYAEGGFLYFLQKHSDSSGEFFKRFDPPAGGRTELQFTLKTGGVKSAQNMWEWSGEEYAFAVEIVGKTADGQEAAILELSQEYTQDGAQATYYRAEGQSPKPVKGDWAKSGLLLDDPLGGNNREWVVTASLDFTQGRGIFLLHNKAGEGYSKTVEIKDFSGFSCLKIRAKKKGQSLRWEPVLSSVKLTTQ